jgi:outer membrane protein OmpA-like peptidoglycan-associated protein
MIRKFVAAVAALFLVTACTNVDPVTGERTRNNTGTGAIIGAIVGAGAGTLAGGDDRRNAMIGAGIGAIAGGLIGNYMDRVQQNLRERLAGTGVSVDRVSQDRIRLIFPADLTFDFNRDTVKGEFVPTLRNTGAILSEYDQTTVDVIGHADSVGSDDYNLDLSRRRAGNIASVLQSGGVSSYRILREGMGESQPVASNSTDDGRARNRRVEVYVSAFQG